MASRQRISQRKYPERQAARAAVARAVRSGRLIRTPCEVCGALKVQGHHPDYAHPLRVQWLCSKHHGAIPKSHQPRYPPMTPERKAEIDAFVLESFWASQAPFKPHLPHMNARIELGKARIAEWMIQRRRPPLAEP